MFSSNKAGKQENPAETTAAEDAQPARAVSPVERALSATTVRVTELKPSIISEGFSFTGEIVSEGPLHVEGRFKGTVRVSSATVGANGTLEGSLTCSVFRIKGAFEGEATCDELVVDASASIRGKIRYRVINVSRGATIVGDLMNSD